MKINNLPKLNMDGVENKKQYQLDPEKLVISQPINLTRSVEVSISDPGKKMAENNLGNKDQENVLENFDIHDEEATENKYYFDYEPDVVEEENFNTEDQEKKVTYSDAFLEYYSRMSDVLNKVKSGDALSKKDKDWLEGELQSIVSGHYQYLGTIKYDAQDLLDSLASNMLQRNKLLHEMLEQTDENQNELFANFQFLQDEFEIKDKEDLLERLMESLEDEEEKENEDDEDKTENTDEQTEDVSLSNQPLSLNHDGLENEERADIRIRQVREDIDTMGSQSVVEEKNAAHYGKIVNDIYASTKKMLESDEFTLEEKAEATKEYIERSQEANFEKEVQRVKADFDRDTVRIAERLFGQHDDIREVLRRNKYKVNFISQDMAKQLLILTRKQ